MGWVKIDDRMAEHPKLIAAGALAGYLHVCAIQYANRNRTDGFIPARAIYTLIDLGPFGVVRGHYGPAAEPDYGEVHAPELAEALVAADLWERVTGGYQVHDYLDYQSSAAEIDHYRAKDRARKPRRPPTDSDESPNGFHVESARIPPRKTEKKDVDVDVLKEVNDPNTPTAARTRARPREAAAAEIPAELSQFDATLRGLPGYAPTAAFYAQVVKYQTALDLTEEAIKMAGWLQQPAQQQKRRQCSPAFVLGWLKRERGVDDARAAAVGARGDNGRGAGPRLFGRQQTSGEEMRRQAIALGFIDDPDARPAE